MASLENFGVFRSWNRSQKIKILGVGVGIGVSKTKILGVGVGIGVKKLDSAAPYTP